MENIPGFQPVGGSTFRNDPALDARLHLEHGYGILRATYRWFCWKRLLIYLPGTVLFLLFSSFLTPKDFRDATPAGFLIVIVIWGATLLASLWGLYQIMAALMNRTTFEILAGTLTIRQGPLPYPGNTSFHYRDLKELSTKQTTKRGLFLPVEGFAADWTPKASFFQLGALLQNGREVDLVYGPDEHVIRYLEAALAGQMLHSEYEPAVVTEVIPDGLEVQQEYGSLKISYSWFSWKKAGAYGFLIVPFLVIAVPYYMQNGFQAPDTFLKLVLMLALPLATLYAFYELLATMINTTSVEVSRERVSIHHGPLPHRGNRSLACTEIDQLFVTEWEHKSDQPASYELAVNLKGGRRLVLCSHANHAVLDYLKQAIGR